MEDAMKSEGEFLIEKELTPIKSRKLVAVDSGEMDVVLLLLHFLLSPLLVDFLQLLL
jgi:hypothetical protein